MWCSALTKGVGEDDVRGKRASRLGQSCWLASLFRSLSLSRSLSLRRVLVPPLPRLPSSSWQSITSLPAPPSLSPSKYALPLPPPFPFPPPFPPFAPANPGSSPKAASTPSPALCAAELTLPLLAARRCARVTQSNPVPSPNPGARWRLRWGCLMLTPFARGR